ncbi:RnfABCDGE type electron transport complex subunit G [bacterium]|nr:RnfABCDGE type electron transport complex subunit G [bacterium]
MNSRAWMIGLLVIMAVICSTALAVVNIKIAPVIERNRQITSMRTVLDVFGVPYDMLDENSIISTYNERIKERKAGELTLFDEQTTHATAVSFEGSGFQGHISLVVALDGETITGFKVVSQEETPGLGSRISEDSFQRSFIGKKVSKGIALSKSGNAGPGEFDAITGATETSKALVKILNKGFQEYFELLKK